MTNLANSKLLQTCVDGRICPSKQDAEDVCDVVRAMQPGHTSQARPPKAAETFPTEPLMFPAPQDRCQSRSTEFMNQMMRQGIVKPIGVNQNSTQHVSLASASSETPYFREPSLLESEDQFALNDVGAEEDADLAFRCWTYSDRDHDNVSNSAAGLDLERCTRSWRRACEQQREKMFVEKELIRRVADWGPELGTLVDLYTGKHRMVKYWLRDDVRALCVLDREDTQLRIFYCDQMEACTVAERAPSVAARHFFLGLTADDIARGIYISMESSAHNIQVVRQGHAGTIRAQLLLLCKNMSYQRALCGAVRALISELLVHARERCPDDAFQQLTDRSAALTDGERIKDDNDVNANWPADSICTPAQFGPTPDADRVAIGHFMAAASPTSI